MTDDETTDATETLVDEPDQLSDDVIATINALMEATGEPPANAPMDPKMLVENFKPQIRMKVFKNPDSALETVAVLNQATSDILDKHADAPTDVLARRGLQDE